MPCCEHKPEPTGVTDNLCFVSSQRSLWAKMSNLPRAEPCIRVSMSSCMAIPAPAPKPEPEAVGAKRMRDHDAVLFDLELQERQMTIQERQMTLQERQMTLREKTLAVPL